MTKYLKERIAEEWAMLDPVDPLRRLLSDVIDVLSQPAQEPPSEWAGIKAILDEYGLQAIDFVADWKAAQPAQEHVPWGASVQTSQYNDVVNGKGTGQIATTPQQRPWVSLTDEDARIAALEVKLKDRLAFDAGMFAAANILEEKNT